MIGLLVYLQFVQNTQINSIYLKVNSILPYAVKAAAYAESYRSKASHHKKPPHQLIA